MNLPAEAGSDTSPPSRGFRLPPEGGDRAVFLLCATGLAAVWLRCGPLPAGLLDEAAAPPRPSSIATASRCTRPSPAADPHAAARAGRRFRRWPKPPPSPPRIAASGVTPASIRSPSRARSRRNLAERRVVEGGSTITQQVAKLLLAGRRRSAAAAGGRRCARPSSRCASSIA